MNTALKIRLFSTYIALVVVIVWLWTKIANFCARFKRNILTRNLGSFPTTKDIQTAAAQLDALENQGLKRLNNKLTASQRRHLASVKSLPCGVCGAAGPSDAHHIEQGLQYTCIPLCKDCHQGSHNGIHGQRRIWNVMKKTEMTVLNDTIEKLTGQA